MITNSPHASFRSYKSILVVLAVSFGITSLSVMAGDDSQTTSLPPSALSVGGSASRIPFSVLGAKATTDCNGEGTGIKMSSEGAYVHTDFQKLAGRITREGLLLESTDKSGGSLQLTARAIGREGSNHHDLPKVGSVTVGESTVVFTRPGLTEEYSVSMDGVRQDFIVAERPAGTGQLQVDLGLSGARAEAVADGAKLTFDNSSRELTYNRLHVVDAAGRTLAATLKVLAADHLAVSVDDKYAVYPVRIDPTFSDADWVRLNPGMPGANDVVSAVAVDGSGNVYIGGEFTAVGTVTASHVAMWNGSVWSSLGSGVNGSVNTLVVRGNDVYVGGSFTTAGVVTVSNIAIWNGSAWSSPGSGVSGGIRAGIRALAVLGNDVFAAGLFTAAGGVVVNNIAKWDGLVWSALGSGTNSLILDVEPVGSDLYAAGTFSTAGGTEAKGLAKWNGSAWSALNDGIGYIGSIFSLAADGTDLYVGGDFSLYIDKHLTGSPHGDIAHNIAKWNGSAWSILGMGTNGIVHQLAAGGGTVYASGSFSSAGGLATRNIAKWNGSTWTALGDGLVASARALAVSGNNLYVGGAFRSAGGVTADFIAKWDSTAWSAMGSGMDGEIMATAVSGSDLYVGGNFTTIGGVSANRIAKWNGSVWSSLGTGMNHDVFALQVIGSDLYAGGRFTTAGDGPAGYIAKWNGSHWAPLGSGTNSIVQTMAAMGTDLYTVGYFQTPSGMSYNTVAKWDGITWTALGSGMNNEVSALAVGGANLYAAGYFTMAGGVPANRIAKWDGSVWSPLGGGMDSMVYALAVSGPDLYAGGQFSTAGGVPAKCIAKWNGSEWSALGPAMTGPYSTYILALAVNGTALYAGGEFYTAGGVLGTQNLAEWTGTEWLAIGSGVNGRVSALSVSASSQLFVGGSFTLAGTTLSPHIVQADILLATPLFGVQVEAAPLADGSGPPVNFGSIAAGGSTSKIFTITNSGEADLTLAPITSDGANTGDFMVGPPASNTLTPGSSTTFTITFTPAAIGLRTAAIHIVGTGDYDIPFDIALTGTGTAIPIIPPFPEIDVKQPAGSNLVDGRTKISFGTVKVGKSGSTKTFIIKNTGTAPLNSIAISKDGKHHKDFIVTSSGKTSLAPGSSTLFKVKFQPTAKGTREAWIHIQSNDANENKFDIKLTGLGAAK